MFVGGFLAGWGYKAIQVAREENDAEVTLRAELAEKDARIEELEARVQQYGSDSALLRQQVDDLEQALADDPDAYSIAQKHEEKEQALPSSTV